MVKVLFVCMGNICRSPTAQGVFARLLKERGLEERIRIDSAGTHGYHVGSAPDPRACEAAMRRGVDLREQRARRLTPVDFEEFDYVLVMDRENLAAAQEVCPPAYGGKLRLLLEFAADIGFDEVPDPYYGGAAGFERVLDLVEAAAEGLLAHIRREHLAMAGGRSRAPDS
jgi:protein-tyrosine phosphatase